jgi:hypothetical protein
MGFIQVNDVQGQNLSNGSVNGIHDQNLRNGSVDILSTEKAEADGFRTFEIVGFAADEGTTPTGMRDEILLLSWLIVLLRTREDGQINYEWAYKGRGDGAEHEEEIRRLSADEVMTGLQSNTAETAVAISRHVAAAAPNQCIDLTSPQSLLLSTGSMSQKTENGRDEVSEWPIYDTK